MSEIKGRALGLIAIILGGLGLTLGSYNFLFPAVQIQETNNYSNDLYHYCLSGSELQEIVDDIGSGDGIIIIKKDIILNDTINISKGGNYVIQGFNIKTIELQGDISAFSITNASSCIIKDISIDGSALTSQDKEIIHIKEGSNHPVSIFNVNIYRKQDNLSAIGIYIECDNVLIEDCEINSIYTGIDIRWSSNSHIICNSFSNIKQDAIYSYSCSNTNFESNDIYFCDRGIFANSNVDITFTNNIISSFRSVGIRVNYPTNSKIIGNTIYNNIYSINFAYGISTYESYSDLIILDNTVCNIEVSGGIGYGIYIEDSYGITQVMANMIISCDTPLTAPAGSEVMGNYIV